MAIFQLEDQLAFYGAFHHNKLNQLIHIIFVPLIVWSSLVFLVLLTPGSTHSFVELDSKSILATFLPEHGINFSLVAFLFYAVYYLTLDFVPALIYDCFLFFLYSHANHLAFSSPNALWIALAVHLLSWFMQIYPGHIVLERRRPALLDSFFQSLILAPIFTFFELLFALGFRKKLYDRVTRRVVANIKQFRDGVPPTQQKF